MTNYTVTINGTRFNAQAASIRVAVNRALIVYDKRFTLRIKDGSPRQLNIFIEEAA